MKSFKQFILEYLNPAQERKVQSWLPTKTSGYIYSPRAEEISSHIIPEGRHSTVIPAVAHTMRAVHAHLDANGFTNHDYARGTTVDRHGRETAIGKALEKTKAPDQLKNDFANDDRENAAQIENYDIVISRHPYHVAEGSTNKPWKSCAGLTASGGFCRYGQGAAARKLKDEIEQGTHVAYLVPKLKKGEESDNSFPSIQKRIDRASARIYLKPHSSEESGHTVLHPENKVYSKTSTGKNLGFLRSVQQFAKTNFPMNDGEVYKKNRAVYDDDNSAQIPKFNVNDNSIKQLLSKDAHTRRLLFRSQDLSSEQIHKLIDTAHPDDLPEIVGNNNLNSSHIKKLFDKEHPNVNYQLMMKSETSNIYDKNDEKKRSKLIPQEMRDKLHEKIIDSGKVGHLLQLPRIANMNKQNLHRLIDKILSMYKSHSEKFPNSSEEPEGLRHVISGLMGSKTPLDQDHINQLYDSGNMHIHKQLAANGHLSYDQLLQATKAAKKHYDTHIGLERDANIKNSHPYNNLVSAFFRAHKRLPGNENKSTYDIVRELDQ